MTAQTRPGDSEIVPVIVENREAGGSFVILCDHASNHIPSPFGTLGLSPEEQQAHIAWDPGAIGVAREMARLMDAPLIYPTISRLIVDCNRPEDAPDLIPAISESTRVPGNQNVDQDELMQRLNMSHRPFHSAIEKVLNERRTRKQATALVSVHTFTATYRDVSRPWEIGVLSDKDRRLADPLIEALKAKTSYCVGDNEPYAPKDRVYYTLDRHGEQNGLPSVMLEIRNNEVRDPEAERDWAKLLAKDLMTAHAGLEGADA